jgi:uncharacterized RDD family membrane protein YckC
MTIEYRGIMTENIKYVGLVRRLMAIIYDLFLLLAMLFIATSVAMVFNQGKAIAPGHPLYASYVTCLLIISFCFYGWFWTHGGQTLGMKTWKMKLQQNNGRPVTWPLAFIRYITAVISWSAAGLGFFWSLFNPKRRTWHDIASNSVLIDLRPGK